MKKTITVLMVLSIILSSLLYFLYGMFQSKPEAPKQYFGATVEIALAQRKLIDRHIVREGKLQPENSIEIKSQVSGTINKINVSGGDKVKEGYILVELESTLFEAQVKEAEAKLVLADYEYKIAQQLASENNASKADAAKKKAALLVAEAALAKATHQLVHAKIKAPFEGYISIRNSNKISRGALVDRNTAMMILNDNDPMILDFRIPEKDAGKPYVNQPITVTIDSFLNRKFQAVIKELSPRIDASGGLLVRAHLPNKLGILKPGMSCKVKLVIEHDENALTVPEEAIQTTGSEHYIFRVRNANGKKFAEKVIVKLGILNYGYRAVVSKNLKENDHIIVLGNIKISNGYPVREVNLEKLGIIEKKPEAKKAITPNPKTTTKGKTKENSKTTDKKVTTDSTGTKSDSDMKAAADPVDSKPAAANDIKSGTRAGKSSAVPNKNDKVSVQ